MMYTFRAHFRYSCKMPNLPKFESVIGKLDEPSEVEKRNKEKGALLIMKTNVDSDVQVSSYLTSETISDSTECYAGLSVRFESFAASM